MPLHQQDVPGARRAASQLLAAAGASLSLGLGACTNAPDAASDNAALETAGLILQFDADALRGGRATPLVEGITAAENQLFTSTGRLLVSGDDGIVEIVRSAEGAYQARTLHTGENCSFGGLAELSGTIYANCYDMQDSALFAARLTDAPEFRAIHQLPGIGLANGLASDGHENLFMASTFDGKIIRLQVAQDDPLAIAEEGSFQAQSGLFTNGLKYYNSSLYWTAFTTLYTAPIQADGTSGRIRTLGSAATFFDDLYVDGNGGWVADYLNGSMVAIDHDGKVLGSTRTGIFNGPSSVQPALSRLGLPPDGFLVTERGANRLTLLQPVSRR